MLLVADLCAARVVSFAKVADLGETAGTFKLELDISNGANYPFTGGDFMDETPFLVFFHKGIIGDRLLSILHIDSQSLLEVVSLSVEEIER